MKYHPGINIISLLLITAAYGMENTKEIKLHIIEEIPMHSELRQVTYITNNTVFVNSLYESCIMDLETKKECSIDINHNRSERQFALLQGKNVIAHVGDRVMIYDTHTQRKRYILKRILDVAANPSSNIIFLTDIEKGYPDAPESKNVIKYNCETETTEYITIMPERNFTHMAIHPTQPIMCIPCYSKELSFRSLDNLNETIDTFIFDKEDSCSSCKYSVDGSYIVGRNSSIIHIFRLPEKEPYYSIKAEEWECFGQIVLHPKDMILAILSTKYRYEQTFINYWDLARKKHIGKMECKGDGQDFYFSPNGLEAIITLKDKFLRVSVPFPVKVKNDCIDLLARLNLIKEQKELPTDIIRSCIDAFLSHLDLNLNLLNY